MTSPVATQSNAKAWVATVGGLIIAQLPLILQFMGHLPAPYGVIATSLGAILAAVNGKVTHSVSNAPDGTVLVPTPVAPPPVPPVSGPFRNPWK